MSKRKGDRRLTGSTGARVTAFFLLVVSFVLGLASAAAALWMYGPNYGSKKEMVDALIWVKRERGSGCGGELLSHGP